MRTAAERGRGALTFLFERLPLALAAHHDERGEKQFGVGSRRLVSA